MRFLTYLVCTVLALVYGLLVAGAACVAFRCDTREWPHVAVILAIGMAVFIPATYFFNARN